MKKTTALLTAVTLATLSATAQAQEPPDDGSAPPPAEEKKKEPGRGDFDAGGQVRLPNGPDENDQYATFNWVAVDLRGKYYLLDQVTVTGNLPVALKHPDMLMTGEEPSMFGGMQVTLDARLPKGPFAPSKYETDLSLVLTGAYMKEGALLLSEKDYPKFAGDFHPGLIVGTAAKVKLSSLLDFKLVPVWVYQGGTAESQSAVQIPMSTIVKLGSLLKVSADLGIFTGDDYKFGGDSGGRIAAGGSVEVKLGPILTHAGAGAASLLTGGLYPTIRDSVYLDLNVKYVK